MRPETMKHAISCMVDEIGNGCRDYNREEKTAVMELVNELCIDTVNIDPLKDQVAILEAELTAQKEARLSLLQKNENYRHQVHLVGQHKDQKIAELQSLLATNDIEETSSVLGWDHSLADFQVTDRIKRYLDLQHELALSMNTIYNIQMDDSSAHLATHYCESCFNKVVPEQRIKDIVCPECRSCNHALTPLDKLYE